MNKYLLLSMLLAATCAFASTVKPDGTEVLALFNHDPAETIAVKVAGDTVELKPYETRFVECYNTANF